MELKKGNENYFLISIKYYCYINMYLHIKSYHIGIIINDNDNNLFDVKINDIEIIRVNSEADLIEDFVNLVINFDPDILSGYEIQNSSWGYFFQRAYINYSNFFFFKK